MTQRLPEEPQAQEATRPHLHFTGGGERPSERQDH